MIRKAEGKGMYGRGAAGDPEAVILARMNCRISEGNVGQMSYVLPLVNEVNKW